MQSRIEAIKKVFNIKAAVQLGESFHLKGAPSRTIYAGEEGSFCSVCFMSIDDWGSETLDGDSARNADLLLNLAEKVSNDYGVAVDITAMYPIHKGDQTGVKLTISELEKWFDSVDELITYLKGGGYHSELDNEPSDDGYDMDRYY